jgi:hypothetical protein
MKAEIRYSVTVQFTNSKVGTSQSSVRLTFYAGAIFPERPSIGDMLNFSHPDADILPTHHLGSSVRRPEEVETNEMVIHSWAMIEGIDWMPCRNRSGHFYCLITLADQVCEYVFDLDSDSLPKVVAEVQEWVTGFDGIRFFPYP